MKHLISPVGASLFRNAMEEEKLDGRFLKRIEGEPASRWEARSRYIDRLLGTQSLTRWIERTPEAAAEIVSAARIVRNELNEPTVVYLLASDTLESRVAATLIARHADIEDVEFAFNAQHDVISGLQVTDNITFQQEGLQELVRRVDALIRNYSPNHTRINITGGFKATIPYVTLMAQLYGVTAYYLFEDAGQVLDIPAAPIMGDMDLVEHYAGPISALSAVVEDWSAFQNEHPTFCREAKSMIQVLSDDTDSIASLSPIGEILWRRYQAEWVTYYAPDKVEAKIQTLPDIQRILASKMDVIRSETKLETKGDHYVYDDGNTPNRIYYFTEDGRPYLYKVFEDHDAHDRYWREVSFDASDRREIIRTAKQRRIAARTP